MSVYDILLAITVWLLASLPICVFIGYFIRVGRKPSPSLGDRAHDRHFHQFHRQARSE